MNADGSMTRLSPEPIATRTSTIEWATVGVSALGALLLVVTIRYQRRAYVDTLYTSRLAAMMEHYRKFYSSDMKSARSGAWACTLRALAADSEEERKFRQQLALFTTAASHGRPGDGSISGHYSLTKASADAAPTRRDWNGDAHCLEEVTSFFTVMAIQIQGVYDIANRRDRRALEHVVINMSTYWDWWGPVLRYVTQLRHQELKELPKTHTVPFTADGDASQWFDVLDRFALRRLGTSDGRRRWRAVLGWLHDRARRWVCRRWAGKLPWWDYGSPSTRLDVGLNGLELLRRITSRPISLHDEREGDGSPANPPREVVIEHFDARLDAYDDYRSRFLMRIGLPDLVGRRKSNPGACPAESSPAASHPARVRDHADAARLLPPQ